MRRGEGGRENFLCRETKFVGLELDVELEHMRRTICEVMNASTQRHIL
jgi:hypothetical protein